MKKDWDKAYDDKIMDEANNNINALRNRTDSSDLNSIIDSFQILINRVDSYRMSLECLKGEIDSRTTQEIKKEKRELDRILNIEKAKTVKAKKELNDAKKYNDILMCYINNGCPKY